MPKIKKFSVDIEPNMAMPVYCIYPKTQPVRAVVFVPPLIGGSYLEQYQTYYTDVCNAGFLFVSFSYRGHKGSPGKFTFATALKDSYTIAQAVKQRYADMALYALGSCFASMPLFYCLSQQPNLFNKLILVNALAKPKQTLKSTWLLFFLTRKLFNSRITPYLITRRLLPHIDQSNNHFGLLNYTNTHLPTLFYQYITLDPTVAIKHLKIPTLCCYGTQDHLLGLDQQSRRSDYETKMRHYFSTVTLQPFDTTHYFENSLPKLHQRILQFLQAHPAEQATLPLPAYP